VDVKFGVLLNAEYPASELVRLGRLVEDLGSIRVSSSAHNYCADLRTRNGTVTSCAISATIRDIRP